MNLDAADWVYGWWAVNHKTGNWTALLYRRKGEERAELEMRFRWYSDDDDGDRDPFSGSDRKTFFTATQTSGGADIVQEMAASMDTLARAIATLLSGIIEKKWIDGPTVEFIRFLASHPMAHFSFKEPSS